MPPKNNPLKLDKFWLDALTSMQACADLPDGKAVGADDEGAITMPALHGDRFHAGDEILHPAKH